MEATRSKTASGEHCVVVSELLARSCRIHRRPLTPELREAYGEVLAILEPARLRAAWDEAERHCKFFPKPAEILACATTAERKTAGRRVGCSLCLGTCAAGWLWVDKQCTAVRPCPCRGPAAIEAIRADCAAFDLRIGRKPKTANAPASSTVAESAVAAT